LVIADCSVELLTPVRIPAVNLLLSDSPTLLSRSFAHFDYAIVRLDYASSISSAVGEVGFWLGSLGRALDIGPEYLGYWWLRGYPFRRLKFSFIADPPVEDVRVTIDTNGTGVAPINLSIQDIASMVPISPKVRAILPYGTAGKSDNAGTVQVQFNGDGSRRVILESEPPDIIQIDGSVPSGVTTSGFGGRATGRPRAVPLSTAATAAIVIAAILALVLAAVGVRLWRRRRARRWVDAPADRTSAVGAGS
jgi:hypothetical protein